jgi:hypothetical protein
MPRTAIAYVVKDFNDALLVRTIQPSPVLAMADILINEDLYKPHKDDGTLIIRKKFKELAEPRGFKVVSVLITEIVEASSSQLKGVKLNGKNKRTHKRTKGGPGDSEKRSGRRARETTTNLQ